MTNQDIRIHCQQLRKNLPKAMQAIASASICARTQALEHYQRAKRIALYSAVNGEIDLNALFIATSVQGKTCYFPIMNADHTLAFLPVTPATVFKKNKVGIAEPDVALALAITPDNLDIIFLPLVAFDEHGTRLGMGGGYYDKTLAHHNAGLLIGVGYAFQLQPSIQANPWDVPMDAIITEHTTYWSKP